MNVRELLDRGATCCAGAIDLNNVCLGWLNTDGTGRIRNVELRSGLSAREVGHSGVFDPPLWRPFCGLFDLEVRRAWELATVKGSNNGG